MEENVTSTHLADAMKYSPTTSYDENAKELLSDKNLLAHILAGVVEEFEGWEIHEIIPCIDGEPEISKMPVDVVPCIVGSNTEDTTIDEGKITYDIRFNIILPVEEDDNVIEIKLLIDVEMQNKATGLGYKLLNRATYSVARMISSQKNREFTNDNYDGIKKVYSIWICASPEARYRNTILKYSMKEEVLYGNVRPRVIRSLQNIVMINLDGRKNLSSNEEEKPTLVGLLNTIFTSPLSSDEKINRLEIVYNIPRTVKIKEGVARMCNLSSGILEEGMAKGRAEGMAKGRAEGMAQEKSVGITILITTLRELGQTEEQIIEQLMKKYNLTQKEANKYMQCINYCKS